MMMMMQRAVIASSNLRHCGAIFALQNGLLFILYLVLLILLLIESINGLCKEGLLSEASMLLKKMEESGCSPDGFTYNIIAQGFLRNNETSRALQHLHEMVEKGFSANAATVAMLMHLSDNSGPNQSVLEMLHKSM
ncbi:hypothetical protein F0562_032125 [Nyssa sinensis]|uniref:Pentacotripeptide-repeat region of PRORP domain-containing protein n=1 Tax=Nyssa sinensis TaxID=561372 RepID=A0A5J5AXP5_9ASTE|nr:hypothetical protein F0562_032125 [Nyssa sinensis]